VDVEPVRRWLLDCALRGPTPHGVGAQAITLGALLSWVLGTRAGRLDGPPHAEQAVRFWRAQSDAELIAGEEERLEEELCRVADIESGEARALVRMGTASALTLAARQASTEGDLAEAEALCIRGLRQLEAVGREKSELGWIVAELRCDVASAQGDFQRATRYGEAAFIGRREAADGSIDQLAIGALIKLATCKARIELSEALCLIDEAIEGLADERDDTALSDLHRGRVQVIGAAGMAAREAGDQAMAGRRYEEALDALTELGERDSRLGHALVHNWAVAAADAGERETSVTLLERALDGRRRLLGRRDPDALSSLCLLASTLAEEDAGPALSLLDAALRELVGDGATPNEIARVRRARASVLLGSGRAAESEENLDRAANSYNEALQELIAIGEHDSLTAYVVMHDLGDVALANGESEIAAARYREAFEGKRRLSGLAVGDTLRTLVALTEAMASSEEEAAVAMIDEAIQDLVADRCDDTQLDMLRIARVRIRLRAGQTAAEDNRLGDAERAFQAAQAEVQGLASPPGHIARSTTLRMAGLEERRGEHARARALCREGLEGWDELGDDERGEVLGAVTDLAHVAVERDPDWAIEMMDGSIALVSATGNPQFVGGLRRNLAVTLLLGARAAAVREELGLARRLCARSLDALDAAGKRDSLLAFVVVHEDARFCDLAGDEQAVALYREAVEGKRRLVGLAHEETISSYLGLADAVAGNDLEQALALLDEPIEELGAVPEAGQLVDRLREGRARAHLSAGRVAEAAGDLDRAERLYAQALEESEAAQGVAKSILTPVLTHDLADVAAKRMDRERAIELYEEALEGKRRLRGLADDATITTLLSLTEVLAEADLPAALARLDEAIQTLAGDAGGIELRQRLREGRAAAHLIAGRSQEAAGSLDEAERLFQATLGELESAGLRDGMLAFSAVHDLGDVARQREDFSQAAEHYEKALAGRRRILGLEHEQTLGTAAAFAEVLCRCDLPAASELSESILRELSASGCEDRALAHGRKIRARVLQAMGREAEGQRRAGEARQSYSRALELLEQSGDRDSTFAYGLVRDLADVAALEGDADRAAALYREAFDGVRAQSGASHQLALACLNGLVLARPADRDASLYLFADAASELEAREAVAEARQVRRAYAHTLVVAGRQASEAGEVDEAERCYREALDQLVAVGERESISAFVALHDLGDVAMMREDAEQAVDLFRAALAGKRRLRSLAHGDTITTLAALVNALNAVDHSQAIELLEDAFGELRGASVAKDDLVPLRELRAAVVLNLGRDADRSDDPRAAERLYRRALDELSEIDRRDSSLAYTIVHDLADARLARGKRRRALKLYREALEGKRRLHGPASEQSVVALLSLANAIALSDLAGALATIDRAIAELGAGEAAAGLVKELRDGRAVTHLEAGRTAEVAGNLDDAQSLYEAVLAELAESGRRDSTLAYVVVHDLGDVALKRGDAAAAAALFEESLQGKWRLRGLAHADTITTLLRLADALVETDSAAALTMLEGHAEELAAQEETAAVARIDSWLKTRRSADDR
jgi:tetratricopeptide (TPR) repeat protein